MFKYIFFRFFAEVFVYGRLQKLDLSSFFNCHLLVEWMHSQNSLQRTEAHFKVSPELGLRGRKFEV